MTGADLDAFMSDEELPKLLEAARISDDIFDVIDLRETQHSDMLAWCLNPGEGHEQGDALIKDFLVAAWTSSDGCAYANKKFFQLWTPTRIRTTSFGAAFLTRELGLIVDDDGRRGRLDLFLVDPVNRIVVTIENKAGRQLSSRQLLGYWDAVRTQVGSRPVFKDYEFLYVYLDRELDVDADYGEIGSKWVTLDYSWLKTAADRARNRLERSSQASQLLMAYCQRQTEDWRSNAEQKLVDTAAGMAIRHERVVARMRELRRRKIAEWTPAFMTSPDGELLRFFHQNRHASRALIEGSGIAAVGAQLRRAKAAVDDYIEVHRQWLAIGSEVADDLHNADAETPEWPVYVVVRRVNDDTEEPNFQVRLVWVTSAFSPHVDPEFIRARFAPEFPDLKKLAVFNRRRLKIGKPVTAAVAVRRALELSEKVETLLRAAKDAWAESVDE